MKTKEELFQHIYASINNGIRSGKSHQAKAWLKAKGISADLTGAGFSSGQMHHRKEDIFIDELVSIGYLTPSLANTSTGKQGYNTFAKEAIVFPLKNQNNEVVNFYAIRINLEKEKVEYLNNEGIYPSYPHPLTQRLYLTNTILDAATLLETRILDNRESVMALHEGMLKEQHIDAIKALNQLKEIVLIN